MKKPLAILGVAVLLIMVVGLSGCEEISDSPSDITSIEEVHKHPNRYLNKEITVKGAWSSEPGTNYDGAVADTTVDFLCSLAINFSDDIDQSILFSGGEYIFTGTLKVIKIWGQDAYCLDVTEVKPT